jgi:two-component system cell cycle response regulator
MLKILVVDDEPENVGLLRVVLRRQGIEVVEANNGHDGLILAEVETPDGVILDWMLPDISGEEFCLRLRNHPAIAHLPILVLSALNAQNAKDKALAAGANHYMTKPANFAELVDQIRRLSVPG